VIDEKDSEQRCISVMTGTATDHVLILVGAKSRFKGKNGGGKLRRSQCEKKAELLLQFEQREPHGGRNSICSRKDWEGKGEVKNCVA